MDDRNVMRVRGLWRAFDRGGLDAVLAIADPDVEWIPFGGGGRTYQGHDGLREFWERRSRTAGGVETQALSFAGYGDRVLVYGSVASGAEERRVWWLYTFEGEKLMRFEAFTDHAEAVRAAVGAAV